MSTDNPQGTADAMADSDQTSEDAVESLDARNFWKDLLVGVATQSWLASMVFHMALMVTLALVLGSIHVANTIGQAPELVAQQEDSSLPEITHFEVGYTPPAPSELTTETLMLAEAPSVEAQFNDSSPNFDPAGGGREDGKSLLGGL